MLRNLLNRVKDHPDLGAQTRDALSLRLQTSLRNSATDVQQIKLAEARSDPGRRADTQQHLIREQERKSFEDRVDAQFRLYKNLMTQARFEERTKNDIMQAMVAMQDEARAKGYSVPTASKAMYDIALAALPLQTHNSLIRKREAGWLTILMGVEKSHVPYPDEPGIYFPPLATWKAIIRARKDKYDVMSLPDDYEGRKEAPTKSRKCWIRSSTPRGCKIPMASRSRRPWNTSPTSSKASCRSSWTARRSPGFGAPMLPTRTSEEGQPASGAYPSWR